ncbi:sugar phosphate isomerase/epimerase [Streptomyces sp. KL118A]|uniref:sugar phosphate isomerase/epimerase family protein n=1 Tax=Streptomyces sp. KL118A TaxID=3045153 RepID=UPI00278C4382|nr:sugar phosphate isomerase/epimerase family protein [Streptomyces sp. KL118A]
MRDDTRTQGGAGPRRDTELRPAAGEPRPSPPPGIRFAGIGDEAAPDLAGQIRAHQLLGWSAIELRDIDGTAVADLDEAAFDHVVTALHEARLDVVCVNSRIANWARPITGDFELDYGELERLAPMCAALGTRHIRVMSYPNDPGAPLDEPEWARRTISRMTRLAQQAEDSGLVLLHENCAGWAGADPARTLRLLAEVDSPALRLLFDTGNGVAYGYEAYDLLTELVTWVDHVQVKDARAEAGGAVYTLPGEGSCRVADCLDLLLDHGHAGTWTIEPHRAVRPHEGRTDAGSNGIDEFVRYGRALERLATRLPAATAMHREAAR